MMKEIKNNTNVESSSSTGIKTIIIHSSSDSKKDKLVGWQASLLLAHQLRYTSIDIIHICQSNLDKNESESAVNSNNDDRKNRNNKDVIQLSMQQLSLLEQVGINEKQLFTQCSARHNLGNIYNGWSSEQQCFALIDGEYGVDFNKIEFQHTLSSILPNEFDKKVDDFSLAALMAKEGVFVHPVAERNSILSTFTYTVNVEMNSYCQLIKKKAMSLGVKEVIGFVAGVNTDEDQIIKSITYQKNNEATEEVIHGDFFFDCVKDSTITAINKTNKANITDNLTVTDFPINKMFTVEMNEPFSTAVLKICSQAMADVLTAFTFGFAKLSRLHNTATLQCYYHENSTMNADTVLKELSIYGISLNKKEINIEDFSQYLVTEPWQKNSILLGNARATFAPIFNDSLDFLHQDIDLWLSNFPSRNYSNALVQYYNETSHASYLSQYDFLQAHYDLSQWRKNDFWQNNQFDTSSSLKHVLEVFQQTGTMPQYEVQTVDEKKWRAFLMGFECIPQYYDPLVDNENKDVITKKLSSLNSHIEQFLNKLPSYSLYLEQMGI